MKTQRKFKKINDKNMILDILNKYAHKKDFYIKGISRIRRVSFDRNDNYIKLNFPDQFKEPKSLTIFTLLNKYIEFDLKHIPHEKLKHLYKVEAIRVAVENRSNKRYNTKGYGIRISKVSNVKVAEDINPNKLPVYVRVILNSYENKYSDSFNHLNLKVDTYGEDDNHIIKFVKKHNKIVYIRDCTKIDDYLKDGGRFKSYIKGIKKLDESLYSDMSEAGKKQMLDEVRTEVNAEVREEIEMMKENEIKTVIYYPIQYDKNKKEYTEPFPIGYIMLYGEKGLKTPFVEEDIIPVLDEIAENACNTIAFGSSKTVEVNEDVLDISKDGMKLTIKDKELIKIFLENPTQKYQLTINFRSLPSLNFWAILRYYNVLPDKSFEVGFKFISETKKDELRLRSIATLENYLKHLFEQEKEKKKK